MPDHLKFIPGVVCIGCLLLCAASNATSYGAYLGLSAEIADVEYTERVDGRTVNTETGSLPYGDLTLGYRRINDLYLAASFTFSSGSVGYDGLSQLGQPISTSTHYDIADYRALVGRSYTRGAIYLGIGRSSRERDIRSNSSVQGLVETQKYLYGILGADLILYEQGTLRVKWDTRLTTSFDSTLDIRFTNSLDDARLDTGRDSSVVAEIEFLRHLPGHWSFAIIPKYTLRTIRRSEDAALTENGSAIGLTYFHPESRMKELGLRATVSRYF